MKHKKAGLIFLFFLFIAGTCLAQTIKRPNVSGAFYPASGVELQQQINQFLSQAEINTNNQDVLAVIAPHAGYIYSGSVAAFGFKAIKNKSFKTVIIIGPSHFARFEGVSVYSQGAWQTPLGEVAVDEELARDLIAYDQSISFYPPAFAKEHSVEVELPFLQSVLSGFKIVPVVIGGFSFESCQVLARALQQAVGARNDVLIVASTDMSHYHPYQDAVRIDNNTISALREFNPQALYNKLASGELELCGGAAVIAAMLYAQAQGATEMEILKYANSGDTAGDKSKVVGYLSAVIYAQPKGEGISMLNEKQKKRLLEIARSTIDRYVKTGETAEFSETDPVLLKPMGAFVTIHKQGMLRGCIGNIIGQQPLYLTVRDMAVESAAHDYRFNPIKADELKDIDLEISVLSEPREVKDAQEIKMGTHGVIVRRGAKSGVFLPQVADETGWSREEFLSNLCAQKAGLSPNAWQDAQTKLYSFSAQVFGEKNK